MSWLLFLDESGHDHHQTPYEVRGGFAMHASKLWPFIQAVRAQEQAHFGSYLSEHGSEIKGEKLLRKDRFKWERQGAKLDEAARRKHALNFLTSASRGVVPRRDEFTAMGQASISFVEQIFLLLRSHNARLFASVVPHVKRPSGLPLADIISKDQVFLFERFFYFLEERREMGLIVVDGSEKTLDRTFVSRMERYFTTTLTGLQRTQWIVPVPLFVESDMAYGVQIADLIVYTINWGMRFGAMSAPTRPEVEPFAWLLEPCVWHGEGYRRGEVFKTHGVVFVPDPFEDRRQQK